MCGIAGGINSALNYKQAGDMLARLRHRGPDDSGLFMQDGLWLGNTRLAIQDLSTRGHQPMQTPDGRFTLVFNGEIYNDRYLRPQLEAKGAIFSSECDTETLLHCFAQYGANCVDLIRGDFAFAAYDAVLNEVFIARDPIGVKPLYYYFDGRQFLFSSELKAITGLSSLDYTLQPEVFSDYLIFQYGPTADTPFRFIRKLLPGHCIRISLRDGLNPEISRYHTIPFTGSRATTGTMSDWALQLEDMLREVVTLQLESDAPVGLTLSGGLDSSLIAALARKAQPKSEFHAFCINTHGAFRTEGFGDDLPYAHLVAKQYGIHLHEVSGSLDVSNELDRLIWQLDEPIGDPAALHMLHISKAAHDMGIKVLLNGTGGDDVFSGYRRHQAIRYMRAISYLGPKVARLSPWLLKALPGSSAARRISKMAAGAGLTLDDAMIHTHFWMEPARVFDLFNQDAVQRLPNAGYDLFKNLLREIPDETNALNKMLFWEQRTFLPHLNLTYMDRLCMANAVEARVPFADKDIVALAAAMPAAMKLKGNTTKAVLREVARHYLSPAIIDRKKTGFGAPLRSWIKQEGHQLVNERLLDNSFLSRGIFNATGIEALIRDNESGKIDGAYTLFSLLSIESWLRQFAALS